MIKKGLQLGLAGLIFSTMTVQTVFAEEVIDEKWGKPIYVYGSALTEEQVNQVAKTFGVDVENTEAVSVSGEDMVHYLNDGNADSNMYSSALVERSDDMDGIEVIINEPGNITKITEDQYRNAMITAGVTDAKVQVTSPVAVTGESALTGIYKAYDSQGEGLDQDRMEVAQEELDTTSDITQENKDVEGFSEDQLNDALIAIKQQLAENKGDLTKEEIEEIINNALDERGLGNVITAEQASRLVNLAENYQETDAINSEEVKQQLSDLGEDVANKLGDLKDKAVDSGLVDKIKNFFVSLFESIANLFKSN